ncbi:RNA polymerase sigma factor [Salegentibacter chungangensis]|uniref:RNA polymerase sigma factor n=1 Tax=Salegentibacter chungangensis TaxID=1335724 RepID=A0ABW3NT04_9FLAO
MTPTITHTEDLVARCREGDQRAQLELYERYYKAMYNTALRIVKDTAEAEDIMQEAFLNAFTKLDSFQGTSTFGAWLKKIVVNKSINAFNKKTRHPEVSYNDELRNEADDHDGILTGEEQTNEKVKMILRALSKLKENYRISLMLHLIEGYDYEEICEILDISYANCRTTISRAKESLRKKLMKYEN